MIFKTAIKNKSSEKLKFFESLKENKFFAILMLFLMFGMLLGVLSVKYFDGRLEQFIFAWFKRFIEFRSSASFIHIYFNVLFISLTYLFLILIFSAGLCGVITLPVILLIRGFGTAMIAGVLYREFYLQGIAFANLILLPTCVAFDFILLYIGSFAFEFSFCFFTVLKNCDASELRINIINLLRRAIFSLLAIIPIAFIEAILTSKFIKFFTFT